MMSVKLFLYVAFFFVITLNAQKNEEVLFTVDNEKVYTSEFIRVYKKNKDIVVATENKNFDDYFNLFVDFKLKLKQAYDLKLDTSKIYMEELRKYREQLIEPYLQNTEATEQLIKEAYDRTLEEVNASHILIKVGAEASPKDTILAYNKITELRNSILDSLDFEEAAKQYSEDPSAMENGGNLGYFSAFSMVYTFENAAYQTEIGAISNPFRTQFGYHILKVNNKRKTLGEVQVAHIMVKNNPEDSTFAKSKIFDIYTKLEQGDNFSTIAKEHSDDVSSAQKGGVLPQFGTGRMIKPFEDNAFNLQQEGDFTKPFKTEFGWHILKLLKKIPVRSYAELHEELENKIKNGNRSVYLEKALADKLQKQYKIIENKGLLSFFYNLDTDGMNSDKTILQIENENYTTKDFSEFLKTGKKGNIAETYDNFRNQKIIIYHKEHLEETNDDFAHIYKEYKDGLLLFELLQKNIWDKSENDSIGLHAYFEENKEKYTWKKRAELTIASCTAMDKAVLVKQYLEENKSIQQIKDLLNEGATIHVLFSSGILEEGTGKLPKDYLMNQGVSKVFSDDEKHFTVISASKIIPSSAKMLEDTKGEVINDYQIYLEEKWVNSLRKMYPIELNNRAFNKLKKQYANL